MKRRKTERPPFSIRALLFRQGLVMTLEYLCTYSVFSVD